MSAVEVPAIAVQDLVVDLGGRRILDGVSLTVSPGEVVGLLGPNGSGKSTLIKTLYGVHVPTAGSVRHHGRDLGELRGQELARTSAVVAQDAALEFDVSVWELVELGRSPHRRPWAWSSRADDVAVSDALRHTGCLHLADRSVHQLSGGERQRVLVARALAQGSGTLLLDEPTNQLDVRHQIEVFDVVTSLGRSVLAALHDLGLALTRCDRVYVLDAGRIVAHGAPTEVLTSDVLRPVYGLDGVIVEHPRTGSPHLLLDRVLLPKGTP